MTPDFSEIEVEQVRLRQRGRLAFSAARFAPRGKRLALAAAAWEADAATLGLRHAFGLDTWQLPATRPAGTVVEFRDHRRRLLTASLSR